MIKLSGITLQGLIVAHLKVTMLAMMKDIFYLLISVWIYHLVSIIFGILAICVVAS